MANRGHEAPHLDYAAEPDSDQLKLDTEKAIEPIEVEPPEASLGTDPTGVKLDSRIPSPAKERLEIDLEEAEREWDRKDANHPLTMGQNRREVGGPLLTGEDIEVKERVKPKPSNRPKKDRRHLGSLGKMQADDTIYSVREKAEAKGPSVELTEEDKELGRHALEAAKRQLGL